jgi:uncharacterized membrane protein YbhN (UPF0104 family)
MASLLQSRTTRLGLMGVSTAAGIALFLAVAHPGRLVASLGVLPLSAVASAVAATMAGVMLTAFRWRSLLAAGKIEAPTARLFAALTMGAAVNNVVPARAGDAVRIESAHRLTGAPRLAIAGTMVSERILDAFVLAVLIVTGAVCAGAHGTVVWLGATVGAVVVVVAFVLARYGSRILRGRAAALGSATTVFAQPNVLAATLATTVAIWLADVLMYGTLAHGFGLQLSFGALLLLVGAGNLALAIPGAAAGLGSFELVTLAGAHGIGLGGASLAAFVLAAHAVIVLPTTVTGILVARYSLPSRALPKG